MHLTSFYPFLNFEDLDINVACLHLRYSNKPRPLNKYVNLLQVVFFFFFFFMLLLIVLRFSHTQDFGKMSGAHEYNRKRQPPKMFVLMTDLKVQDQLDGTIRLQRGFLCQEQDRNRGDFLWVKVHAQHAFYIIGRKR